MRPYSKFLLASAGLALLFSSGIAQTAKPAVGSSLKDRLYWGKTLYYNPTASGLKTFQCNVDYNWKDFLSRFSGTTIADDNPTLVYLQSTKLSIFDDLKSGGKLVWVNSATVPTGLNDHMTQMRTGMQQMVEGYFQSWNVFMNGSIVPAAEDSSNLSERDGHLLIHEVDKSITVDMDFDQNMLLVSMRALLSDSDTVMIPTFIQSPDGLLLGYAHSIIHQPPNAPPTEVNFTTTYAKVGKYQLPSKMNYEVKNVGVFEFPLSGCVANPDTTK